jgi:hypothetical protein
MLKSGGLDGTNQSKGFIGAENSLKRPEGPAIARCCSELQPERVMRRYLMVAIAALALAACDDDSTGADVSVEGTYQLQSIAGLTIPAVLINEPTIQYKFEWLASELLIRSNGSFREIDQIRETDQGVVSTQVDTTNGTWTITSSNAISLTAEGQTLTGTWDGNQQLSFTSEGVPFVFRR